MGTKIRIPPGKFQVHDTAEVGGGWKLYTYEPDTAFATPKATYQDKDGASAHANPIIFDSRGEKDIWWDGLYDIKLTDDLDNTIWTMEDAGQGAFEGEARTGPQAVTHNMASDADYTLTSSQEGYGRVIITDTLTNLTTGRNIVCSTDEKGYYFQNDTAQTLTLKTASGTGIPVPKGHRMLLFCDGTNVGRAFVENQYQGVTITPDADTDYTLTATEYAYDRLNLVDGSWSQGRTILIPAAAGNRRYFVDNTAGTYDAAIGISGGASVTVPAGTSRVVLADGTDVTDPQSAYYTKEQSDALKITGDVVQSVSNLSGTLATGTTTIPIDDTIPQNTEGDEYYTLSITPENASNILEVEATINLANTSNAGQHIAALFLDAGADAVAAAAMRQDSASQPVQIYIRYRMTASSTATKTFKLRAGYAAAGTTTVNGTGGNRKFGGVYLSGLKITEYQA